MALGFELLLLLLLLLLCSLYDGFVGYDTFVIITSASSETKSSTTVGFDFGGDVGVGGVGGICGGIGGVGKNVILRAADLLFESLAFSLVFDSIALLLDFDSIALLLVGTVSTISTTLWPLFFFSLSTDDLLEGLGSVIFNLIRKLSSSCCEISACILRRLLPLLLLLLPPPPSIISTGDSFECFADFLRFLCTFLYDSFSRVSSIFSLGISPYRTLSLIMLLHVPRSTLSSTLMLCLNGTVFAVFLFAVFSFASDNDS